MFIFILLGLVSIVNADLTTNNVLYYSFDSDETSGTTMNDLSVSSNDGTCVGMTNCNTIVGKLINASMFDGTDDTITLSTAPVVTTWKTGTYSISGWINHTGGAHRSIYAEMGGDNEFGYVYIDSGDHLGVEARRGAAGNQQALETTGAVATNVWVHYVVVNSGDLVNAKIYINGVDTAVSVMSNTGTGEPAGLSKSSVATFPRVTPINYYDGDLDEFGIYDTNLTSTEVLELYNSGIGFNPYLVDNPQLSYLNITANDIVLINNTFFNTSINFETFVINSSTNADVNQTYSLNGAAAVQYATDNLNGSINLSLSDGNYNISFTAFNNETNVSSVNFSFTVDGVGPVINNSIPLEINTYEFLSTYFSCTDINLVSCNISIDGFNQASGVNFTLIHNGNLSYTITAIDLANNTVTDSGVLLVNPVQLFNFQTFNGTPISNFTFAGVEYETQANVSTYNSNISLGVNTLVFERLGFATTNVTFTVNTTSQLNITTNITESKIILSIFDRSTNTILTGFSEVIGVATNGFSTNTTTGFVNISDINFISEQYQIVVDHAGYATESVFFNYDNQQALPVSVFLLELNNTKFGTATVQVKSFPAELFISNAVCDLLQWRPSLSAYESVAQGVTDVNGEYTFNIQLDITLYKASCQSGGRSQEQVLGNGGIITTTGLTYPVVITTTETVPEIKLDIIHSFTNLTETNTTQRLTFTWTELNGLVTTGCINLYRSTGFGNTFINQTCAIGSTGEVQIIQNINNTFELIAEAAVVTSDGVSQPLDSIIFLGSESFESLVKKYNLDLIIPIVLFFFGLGLGLVLEPANIYISILLVFILEWITFAMIPTTVSFTTVTFISTILAVMYWGVNK